MDSGVDVRELGRTRFGRYSGSLGTGKYYDDDMCEHRYNLVSVSISVCVCVCVCVCVLNRKEVTNYY